jgi:hypothetical protein
MSNKGDSMSMKIDDEVAVLPSANALPSEVVEIAKITHAGPVFVQLEDGGCSPRWAEWA